MSYEYSEIQADFLSKKNFSHLKQSFFSSFSAAIFQSFIEKLSCFNYPFSTFLNELIETVPPSFPNMKLFFESLQRNEINYQYLIECLSNDNFRAEFECYGEYLFKAYKISEIVEMLRIEIWHFNWETQSLTKHRFYDENLHLIVPILSVVQEQMCYYILCSPVSDIFTKPISKYSYPQKIIPKLKNLFECIQDIKENKEGNKVKGQNFIEKKQDYQQNIGENNQGFKVMPVDLLDPEDFQCTLPFGSPPMNTVQFVGKNDGLDNFTKVLQNEKKENFAPDPGSMCSNCHLQPIFDIGLKKMCKCSLCFECLGGITQMERCPLCKEEIDPILVSSYLDLLY
ncbi:hypothetical protein SteCoe_28872 [Stentor coeruleus]|uniref:Uncharacterized protein n=1 Tax=Stentor coeruleus TaxID=5963 RepID=A0A1R2B7C3_9CILI|nr:hypothetical protein SteCoe_28872 [Stentor coeruleus]